MYVQFVVDSIEFKWNEQDDENGWCVVVFESMQGIINTVLLCQFDENLYRIERKSESWLLQIGILLCLLFVNVPFRSLLPL